MLLVTLAAFPVSRRRSALLRRMAMLAFDGYFARVGFVAVLTLTVALACRVLHVFVASGAAHGQPRRPMGQPAVATSARLMSRECLHQRQLFFVAAPTNRRIGGIQKEVVGRMATRACDATVKGRVGSSDLVTTAARAGPCV